MDARTYLNLARHLPISSLDKITRGGGIVVIAPHPDDESLGCGGLIAEASELGCPIHLIFVSDGTGSHPNSIAFPKARLLLEREAEAKRAGALLGLAPSSIAFLRLPDCSVRPTGEDGERAIATIADAADEIDASAIFVTSDLDPHCDHQASFEIVRRVREKLSHIQVYAYPVWAWHKTDLPHLPGPPRGFRLNVKRHLASKRAAIEQHRTQLGELIQDDPKGFRLDRAMIDFFLAPYEIYLEVAR